MNNALVIYDNLNVADVDYKQRVVDITEFFVYSPTGFDLFRTGNLTDTAQGLAQRGYKWMFVNILGHCVDRADIYNEAIAEAEANNYPMMGHLVHYPGAYPTVDSQFFLINLRQWQEVGSPEFEAINDSVRYNTKEVLRSEENFHDDYTPYWIKSGDGQRTYNIYQQLFNQRVVRAFLEAGYTLGNFNQSIRDRKWNLYAKPNQDMRFDVPTIGINTIENLKRNNAGALIVEAGKTVIVDMQEVISLANQYGIVFAAIEHEQDNILTF
mgnify:CR=1 FL=1